MTDTMWLLLRYAKRMHPMEAAVEGSFMRTARILERRGFLSVVGKRVQPWPRCITCV